MKQSGFALTLLVFVQFVSLQSSEGRNETKVEQKNIITLLKDCKAKVKDVICAWSPIRGLKQFFNECFMAVHNFINPKDQYVILESERCKNFTPTRYESKGDTDEASSTQNNSPPYRSEFSTPNS